LAFQGFLEWTWFGGTTFFPTGYPWHYSSPWQETEWFMGHHAAPPRSPWKSSEWSSRRGCICVSSQPTFCGHARACRAASVYWLGFSGALKDACLQDACLNLTTGNQTSKWTLPFLRLKTS
jgi:hypothetical protein